MSDFVPLKIDPAGPGVPERAESGDTVPPSHGGTGKATITEGALLIGAAGNTFAEVGPGTSGQVPISNGTTLVMGAVPTPHDLSGQTNDNAGTLAPGTPVYEKSTAGHIDKARANAIGTANVLGLTTGSITASGTGTVRTAGPLTLTTGQWDAITGQTGGLTAGSRYYLDPGTAGLLTTSPTDSTGNFLCLVGIAVSTTVLVIRILMPIGL